jgi:hypothetical protein
MIVRPLTVAALALAIGSAFGGSAASQTRSLTATTAPAPFLTKLPARFAVADTRPFCRELKAPEQCAPLVVYGGAAGGGLPTIEPAFTAELPHVRVSMVLHKVVNEIVANGGVETFDGVHDTLKLAWTTFGGDPNVEASYTYLGDSLPGPGDPAYYSSLVYDAVVFNACPGLSSFTVNHYAEIRDAFTDDILGTFQGLDLETIDALGYYNFNYTVRVDDADGAVSDFHFSGKVNVTCSAASSV